MKSKIITFAIATATLLIVGAGAFPAEWAHCDLIEWAHCDLITIEENSGSDLEDYQILVELDASNFDFSKAQLDGADIRFAEQNGTLLDYWIEDWDSAGEKAKVWVKVPCVHASGAATICMWYGNAGANDVSDGDAVFEFFDDFESGIIDTTKWESGETATIVDNPYSSGENKVLDVSYDHRLHSKNTFSPPFAYRCSGASSLDFGPNIGVVLYEHYDSTSGGTQLFWRAYPTPSRPHEKEWESAIKYRSSGWSTSYSPTPPYQYGTWFAGETVVKSRSYHAHYVNGILVKEWTGIMFGSSNPGIMPSGAINQAEQYIDWVLIRKYTDPAPTVTVGDLSISVEIDIKPGSDPNCFNNDGHGVIPVAILSDCVDGSVPGGGFDATQVDPATVKLESLAVRVVGKNDKLQAHIEDVNNDGCDDLVVQIEDQDGVFENGETEATITANLYDGTAIEGTDTICIVP